MNRKKKPQIIALFLAVLTVLAIQSSVLVFAANDTDNENKVTRAEWLSDLVSTFEMTVEDENYPDNYFSDLDSSSKYYYDILVAVQFGVVDAEAGDPIYPENPVTREFAASTLNYCLGYQLENKDSYTFTDSDKVNDKDSAQVAINRNWFTLVNGEFCPEKEVTSDEVTFMLKDAKTIWNSTDVDVNHDNKYTLAEGIIEIPDGTETYLLDDGRVYITECPKEITVGDSFAVHLNGIPCVYKAEKIEKDNNDYIIEVSEINHDDAYENIDMQGTVDASALQIGKAAEGLKVEYSEKEAPPSRKARIKGSVDLDKYTTLKVTGEIPVGDGQKASINTSVKNAKIDYSVSFTGETFIKLRGDSDLTCSLDIDTMKAIKRNEITLVPAQIPGIGGLDLIAELSFGGKFECKTSGYLTTGLSFSKANGLRIIKGFNAKSFTFTCEASASAGLKARMGVTGELLPIKGYVYATAGGKAVLRHVTYGSGTPKDCGTFVAYVYASTGATASITRGGKTYSYEETYEIFDEDNSPLRVYHHYEDGKEVAKCSRGNDFKYFTNIKSRYWGSGWLDGIGEYGYDADGNKVPLYTYTLDDDNNATITGYKGMASDLYIPETVDGYTVVGIGSRSFYENTTIESVEFPLTVKSIGNWAFRNCINLRKINMPKNLQSVDTYGWNWQYPFSGCTALKEVNFEEGITSIPGSIFADTGLERVDVPDTVTNIGERAFAYCEKLSYLHLSNSLKGIGNYAFRNTIALTEINVPKTLTDIDTYGWNWQYPFSGSGITKIKWAEGITQVPYALFGGCIKLEQINMPDTITEVKERSFAGCEKLAEVNIPDTVTSIGASAFSGCKSIQNIKLPGKLTFIGNYAFRNCTALTRVTIPKTLTTVDTYGLNYQCPFDNCTSLEQIIFEEGIPALPDCLFENAIGSDKGVSIVIPEGVTWIGGRCFKNFTNLKTIILPTTLERIYDYSFSGTGIENITIPDGIKAMYKSVFYQCKNLEEITIPNSIEELGTYIFSDCTSLTKVILNNTRQNITTGMFQNCTSLEEITLPDSVTNINAYAFAGCTSLKTIKWSASIATIKEQAFYNCDALTEIKIPDSVKELGSQIFYDCDALTDVKLGTGIRSIPDSAFEHCDKLESLAVPYKVTSIGNNVFKNDVAFTAITIPRATTSISSNAFSYPDKLTIYGVPGTYAETFAKENSINFVAKEVKVTKVTVDKNELSVNKGSSYKLKMNIEPENFTDEVSWRSSDVNVATVDDNGLVTAKSTGTTTIKILAGDESAICKLTVLQPVERIYLSKDSVSLDALDTYQLTASVYPENAYNRDVEWKTADDTVATVDETGMIRALKKGSTTVTAVAKDGSGASARACTITVRNNAHVAQTVEEMETPHNYENNCSDFWIYTMENEESLKLTFDSRTEIEEGFDYVYIYSGDGTEIGKYTGKELCDTTIKVPGDTVKIKLVSDKAGNAWGFKVASIVGGSAKISQVISVTERYDKKFNDSSFNLNAVISTGDGTLSYSSDAPEVATVNKDGNVTIKGTGTAQITVTASGTEEYKKTTRNVTIVVSKALQNTNVSYKSDTITEGQSVQIIVENAIGKLTYESDNVKVATVDEDGSVTGIKEGFANIIVKAEGNKNYEEFEEKITVQVLKKESVSIPLALCEIKLSETEYAYDGTAKKPNVTVTYKDKVLTEGTDYTVSYVNNINPGTATVTVAAVTGSDYTGIGRVTFQIKAAPEENPTVIKPNAFSNCADLVDVNIKDTVTEIGDEAFADCQNLTNIYFYGNCPKFGTDIFKNVKATAYYPYTDSTWSLDKLQGYGGEITWIPWNPETKEPVKRELSICVSDIATSGYTYNGEAQTPKVTLKDGDYTLEEGKDYQISCKDNTDAGTASFTITGDGTYGGSLEGTFLIDKAEPVLELEKETIATSVGKCDKVNWKTLETDGELSRSVEDEDMAWVSNTDLEEGIYYSGEKTGTVKVTVTAEEGRNYLKGSTSFTLKIAKGRNEIYADNIVRNYSSKKQYITTEWISDGNWEGLSYTSNSKYVKINRSGEITIAKGFVGQATITVKVAADENYYANTKKVTVTVKPAATGIYKVTNNARRKATVTWKKNTTGNGYVIQYSRDKSFKSGVKTVYVKSNRTTKATLSVQAKGKTYYVRVATYKTVGKKKILSSWSKAKSVKIRK